MNLKYEPDLAWLKAEPNLTTEIKRIINEALNNKQNTIDTWESNIKLEATKDYTKIEPYHLI